MAAPLTASTEEFLTLVASKDGQVIRDNQVKQHFGERYPNVQDIINRLLKDHRIRLEQDKTTNELVYCYVPEELGGKLKDISSEHMMVYQAIERSGNKGVWTADLKRLTSLAQTQMTKCLKDLEKRQLVKSVKSVNARSKKLYMLIDLVPAKDITGGPWYTDNEFDHDFVDVLFNHIVKYVRKAKQATLLQIATELQGSGITDEVLQLDEVAQLINALIFDNRLEEVRYKGAVAAAAQTGVQYKVAAAIHSAPNAWTSMPCGLCRVRNQCVEGGNISPQTCIYFKEWLAMSYSEDDIF